jgi:hypothetical protein
MKHIHQVHIINNVHANRSIAELKPLDGRHFQSYLKGPKRWALVAHACNPSYSEAEIKRIMVQSQSRANNP